MWKSLAVFFAGGGQRRYLLAKLGINSVMLFDLYNRLGGVMEPRELDDLGDLTE